jgi:NADH-quinone oxidoreductase subunit J
MEAAFYIAAAVSVLATVMVVTRLQAIHALLYFIVSLLAVAVVLYTLGAPFAAALEVIIYAGAIVVLFVFVVMMLNLGGEAVRQERRWLVPRMWIGPAALALILLAEVVYILAAATAAPQARAPMPITEVGAALFGPYLLAVELASMLLLAGLVGAFHLARRTSGG